MKATWTGLIACLVVIYFGIVHSSSNPRVLLNAHALTLVCGGTVGISLLTYSLQRLLEVMDFILFGFLFRAKKEEIVIARDLIACIDAHYQLPACMPISSKPSPFLMEAIRLLEQPNLDGKAMQSILMDRRNSVKRRYTEDAKILNNIAKYPPHLGLLGAASGMIEMMSGLGKTGIDSIGASMAMALSATLWGVGLNNFVFLPLSDNAGKAASDDLFIRDVIIECCLLMKKKAPYDQVFSACVNKLSFLDRSQVMEEYRRARSAQRKHYAA